MDVVVGWMTVKPGKRQEFIDRAAGFLAATRDEHGVLFFELLAGDEPDIVVAVEGYTSPEAHQLHVESPHFAEFWSLFQELVISGKFENVTSASHRTDVL
jgi:quinol monooxygenase YgiN